MDSRNPPELPNEMVNYIGTLFGKRREDIKAGINARMVCRQWYNNLPNILHLYILGSPVLVEKTNGSAGPQWEDITAETVQDSFNRIPQDGFLVFSTYADAHLYAHNFYGGREEPNFNNGIRGNQKIGISFLMNRGKFLYHPVVFEVAYRCEKPMEILWHPSSILNLDGKKTMQVSAIREPGCKANLTVLSSKLEVEFIDGKKIELVTLYDSTAGVKKETAMPDRHVNLPAEQKSRCFIM